MTFNLVEESVKTAIKQSMEQEEKEIGDNISDGEEMIIDDPPKKLIYGYIRENFEKRCWIDEIIQKIIQFYVIKGGSLYVFGDGACGKLGIENYKNDECNTPTLCPPFIDNNAMQVSVSKSHTLILDTDGNVWGCGKGTFGQLGNGHKNQVNVPTKLNLDTRVISVSAGEWHSLLLRDNGWVQSFGLNNHGQIGHGDLEQTFVPKTIEKLKKYKIVQINTGDMHSAALTEDGDLFCFGWNDSGECGVGKEDYITTPTKVDFDDEIEFVDCGRNHTLIISRRGLIYSFGWGRYGKLGHRDENNKRTPTLIETLKQQRITLCAAGEEHSLCIDKDGLIWSFGRNYEGQCGLSEDIKEQRTPTTIEWFLSNNIKATECAAGDATSSVIAEDGSLYVFGYNLFHQLGLEENDPYFTPTKLSLPNIKVKQIALGFRHSAVIGNEM